MEKYIDLTGQRFGKLTVIEKADFKHGNGVFWKCLCDCNNIKYAKTGQLRSGHVRSCGCLFRENGTKDKKYGTRIRNIRIGMMDRCYNEKSKNYHKYGGRGIYVCEEWCDKKFGLINFYNWSITNGYADDLSIDRVDNDGPYAPWNCRWANKSEQANNRRSNRFLEYMGEKHTIAEWSKIIGINRATIYKRIKKNLPINKVLQKNSLPKRGNK